MVSSSVVKSDGDAVKSYFKKYNTIVEDATASNVWEGESSNNFKNKSNEFVSEFDGVIANQMADLAKAVDLFKKYKDKKDDKEKLEKELSKLNSEDDENRIAKLKKQIDKLKVEMEKLKSQINSLLNSIKSKVLEKTSLNTNSSSSGRTIDSNENKKNNTSDNNSSERNNQKSNNNALNSAINWAISIANNDSIGYSRSVRKGKSYDCSSLLINAFEQAGFPVIENGANTTYDMKNAFLATGKFEWIPINGSVNINSLKPGDILLDESCHTEMYIGDGKNVAAHDNKDGVDGDSSGKEIDIRNCATDNYGRNWDGILRCKQ